MAPEHLIGKAYALTANEDSRTRDQADPSFALDLPAERALRAVPLDLVALRSASKDHPAATFSFSFSAVLSLTPALSVAPGLGAVRTMLSIKPYSFAASALREQSASVACGTFSLLWP